MYHSVHPQPAFFSVTPRAFLKQMSFVRANYQLCRLSDARRFLINGEDETRRIVVTFDDAYTNFVDFALPILRELNIPCTVFVPTGHIGGWNEWDKATSDLPRRRIMNAEQIRSLRADPLVEFGSHTIDHVRLAELEEPQIMHQLQGSKQCLEELLSHRITSFCYPYGQLGDFSGETTRLLELTGYEVATISRWGTLNRNKNSLELRRVWFEENDEQADVQSKIEGDYDWFAAKERVGAALRSVRWAGK